MKRRSPLAITLIALLMVGTSVVSTSPRDQAQAADPLADAKAEQKALADALAAQKASLDALKAEATALSSKLNLAEAELSAVTAEYYRISGLLTQVESQVAESTARLADLRDQITTLDGKLTAVAQRIRLENEDLGQRIALLQEHLRDAYERTQVSLLEVILSAPSLDAAANQVGYLITVSDQDQQLAVEITRLRDELASQQEVLRTGRRELGVARDAADAEATLLAAREAELVDMHTRLARLKKAAEAKRLAQEAALNAAVVAKGNVEAQIKASEDAYRAQTALVNKLIAESTGGHLNPSAFGFIWPMRKFVVTQEWGPTTFYLEPATWYKGVYYPHFHRGIDIASYCGTPIYAAGDGTVKASGQVNYPYDTAFAVIIDHGYGVLTVYWHLNSHVVVSAGQKVVIGQLVGYEGTTGTSTGCHLHFGVNDHGVWENPRAYLP